MKDEQAESVPIGRLREAQHRNVSVGVAARDQGPTPDPAPDPHRLLRPVIEELDLRLVEQVGAVIARLEVQPEGAPDHPLRRDAVQLLGERAHEVTVTTRRDVGAEPVRLQIAQQLDHRHVAALQVRALQHRMRRIAQPGRHLVAELLHRHAPRRPSPPLAIKQAKVGVVTVVVLDHGLGQPVVVALDCCLVGLPTPQRGIRRSELRQPEQREVELDRDRLLAPQRPVVVEHRHPLGGSDEPVPALVGDR